MVCIGNISSVRPHGLPMTPPCSRWKGLDSIRLVERIAWQPVSIKTAGERQRNIAHCKECTFSLTSGIINKPIVSPEACDINFFSLFFFWLLRYSGGIMSLLFNDKLWTFNVLQAIKLLSKNPLCKSLFFNYSGFKTSCFNRICNFLSFKTLSFWLIIFFVLFLEFNFILVVLGVLKLTGNIYIYIFFLLFSV